MSISFKWDSSGLGAFCIVMQCMGGNDQSAGGLGLELHTCQLSGTGAKRDGLEFYFNGAFARIGVDCRMYAFDKAGVYGIGQRVNLYLNRVIDLNLRNPVFGQVDRHSQGIRVDHGQYVAMHGDYIAWFIAPLGNYAIKRCIYHGFVQARLLQLFISNGDIQSGARTGNFFIGCELLLQFFQALVVDPACSLVAVALSSSACMISSSSPITTVFSATVSP